MEKETFKPNNGEIWGYSVHQAQKAQPSYVLRIKNNTRQTIEDVDIFDPPEQIEKNGVPKEGILVISALAGTTYKKLLYEIISEKKIIGLTMVAGINEDKPLEYLLIKQDYSSGFMTSRPLNIDDRSRQEIKTMGQIKCKYALSVNTKIIIPFILPEQELLIYFYRAPQEPDYSAVKTKKQNIFKRFWNFIKPLSHEQIEPKI